MTTSRRTALALVGSAPFALLVGSGAGADEGQCYDPEALPFTDKRRRRSLAYEEHSGDPARRCQLCAFYTAGEGACGTCQILSGAPVNAGAVCTSFAGKTE